LKTDNKLKAEDCQPRSTGGIAIVSDIHANIDALGAVLTDIAAQRSFTIFCLGDTIGYGPEPVACIKHMREFASVNLMGNHEGMFIVSQGDCRKLGRYEFGELWPPIALCHRHLKASDKKWITKLPLVAPVADMTLVHGSLDQPHTFGYISDKELARDHFDKQTTRLSFYGHTHIPAIWRQKGKRITMQKPGKGPITLDPDSRYAIGVGSVGQPRDYDARALLSSLSRLTCTTLGIAMKVMMPKITTTISISTSEKASRGAVLRGGA
jgi:diadenosine tetraphosphatase ApaH/serine/threonine PP2A family protein phosphatase